jgi:hypothetical protein
VADVLRGPDPDDAGQPEVDVDLHDHAHRRHRERDVRALSGRLPGLRVERKRSRVAVYALEVDLSAPRALSLLERVAASELHGARRHPRHARRRRGPGRADVGRRSGDQRDVVGS